MQKETKLGYVIGFVILIFATTMFAITAMWAYTRYQQEKDFTNNKVAEEVAKAKEEQKIKLEKEFEEEAKDPYREYKAADQLSGVTVGYPKSWSGLVNIDTGSKVQLSMYFHPDEVLFDDDNDQLYAFRVELVDEPYADILNDFDNSIEKGIIEATDYSLPSVEESKGIRLKGEITKGSDAVLILLEVRDKTLKVWTDSPIYSTDFEDILENRFNYNP